MEYPSGKLQEASNLWPVLSHPSFWAAFLPELVASDDEHLEWVRRVGASSLDDFDNNMYLPSIALALPHNYQLIVSPSISIKYCYSETYYYIRNADLPEGGLLGHNNCHCQMPIFRWTEVQRLAQVLQEANPTLPQGAALLLLWPTMWLNEIQFQEAKPIVLSSLNALKLRPGSEFTTLSRHSYEYDGQAAPGELPDVEFEWWELQPGDWANNSLYSLRSITAFPGTKWDERTRKKFNGVLEKLGVSGPGPIS